MLPCLDFALDNYKYHYVKSLSNSFLDGDNCRHITTILVWLIIRPIRLVSFKKSSIIEVKTLLLYTSVYVYIGMVTVLTAVSFYSRLARLTTAFEIPSNFSYWLFKRSFCPPT